MRGATRLFFALVLFLAGVSGARVAAQEEPAEPDLSRIEQLKALDSGDTIGLEPEIVPQELLGEEGVEAQRRALAAYYQYRVDGYQHRQRVFGWQLLSTKIIFVMVILLVLIGVYFSWLQFRSAMKAGHPGDAQETTFEASTSGFKVSSPVLGVIILAISLAFFYLYLVHVYPIVDSL
jgi:hypothetical protein